METWSVEPKTTRNI